MAELERQIRDHIDSSPGLKRDAELLKTIKGVGEGTARILLLVALRRFANARQAVAFVGRAPDPHQSGVMRKRARLSKIGSKRVRTALYFPAIAAAQHDPAFRALRERMEAKGKRGLVIITAVMRKLVTAADVTSAPSRSAKAGSPTYGPSAASAAGRTTAGPSVRLPSAA